MKLFKMLNQHWKIIPLKTFNLRLNLSLVSNKAPKLHSVICFEINTASITNNRSNHQKCFVKETVLKNFAKFTEKHLRQTACSCHVMYAFQSESTNEHSNEHSDWTLKCTVQTSTQNTAQSFGQFGQMVECSFRSKRFWVPVQLQSPVPESLFFTGDCFS